MKRNLLLSVLALFAFVTVAKAQSYTNASPAVSISGGTASTYCGASFSVRNNNAVPIAITDVGHFAYTTNAGNSQTYDLYYTDVPGLVNGANPTPGSAGWTAAATNVTIPGSANGGVGFIGRPIFSGLNITIPPGGEYRFGITWPYNSHLFTFTGGAGSPVFSNNGVDLLVNGNTPSRSYRGYGGTAPPGLVLSVTYDCYVGFITWKFTGRPCTDTPKAFVDAPSPVCPGRPFTVAVNPGYLDASYTWEISDNGTSWRLWTGGAPGLLGDITDAITAPRWYRCRIVCVNTGFQYLTPPKKVDIAPFYYCYCENAVALATNERLDIGNVSVTRLPENFMYYSNGLSTPPLNNNDAKRQYTSFQFSEPPIVMYRDSSFMIAVSEITSAATMPANANVAVFIDYNRDGKFDADEKVMKKTINSASITQYTESQVFTVPSTAQIGLTGMRVIMGTGSIDSCGTFTGEGEVEDYLVDMRYEPCRGPVNAGDAITTDTLLCSEYDYVVLDTNYEKLYSEIARSWQISGDNMLWFDMADTKNIDQVVSVFAGQPLYYRMQAICERTGDTTYSTPAHVKAQDGNKCYCYSQAVGVSKDTSDVGAIAIGDYSFNLGGPHVLNQLATKKRTDHTNENPIQLYTDSLYKMTLYHIQSNPVHSDSKVTVFIDFNNNKQYDIPYERVFTNYTSISNFTLDDTFTIPKIAITGVPTGMRIILNNNIGPNDPSDMGCGAYMSGETHDYMVVLNQKFPAGVKEVEGISNFGLFPNPTTGKFRVQYTGLTNAEDVTVTVSTITGQVVSQKSYKNSGVEFSAEMDMSKQPRGMYYVELHAGDYKAVQKLVLE